jgi:hypothetical protein
LKILFLFNAIVSSRSDIYLNAITYESESDLDGAYRMIGSECGLTRELRVFLGRGNVVLKRIAVGHAVKRVDCDKRR